MRPIALATSAHASGAWLRCSVFSFNRCNAQSDSAHPTNTAGGQELTRERRVLVMAFRLDANKVRQQLGEPAVARLSEQLDRLAAMPA